MTAFAMPMPSISGRRRSTQATSGDELADLLERLAAVADLRDELELRPGAHGAHDAFPEERVVVGDDHAEPGHGPIVAPRCAAGGALVRSEEAGRPPGPVDRAARSRPAWAGCSAAWKHRRA